MIGEQQGTAVGLNVVPALRESGLYCVRLNTVVVVCYTIHAVYNLCLKCHNKMHQFMILLEGVNTTFQAGILKLFLYYLGLFPPLLLELNLFLLLKLAFRWGPFCWPLCRPRSFFQFFPAFFSSHFNCLSLAPALMTSNFPPREAFEFSKRWANWKYDNYNQCISCPEFILLYH